MHDDVHGIELRAQVTKTDPLADYDQDQPMYSQDTPTVTTTFGSAPANTVAEIVGYNLWYQDLPGINANLMTWEQVEPQVISYYGAKVSCVSSATAGAYGAGSAINSVTTTSRPISVMRCWATPCLWLAATWRFRVPTRATCSWVARAR